MRALTDGLYEAIFKRKSFHFFAGTGGEKLDEHELEEIKKAYETFTPLYPGIKTAIKIVPEGCTNCRRGAEYCILMYSEKKDGYLQNIGYLGEQLDLWLVSRNIGTLWYGIGKTKEKEYGGLDYVIMIAIRRVSDGSKYRLDMFKSKRKPVEEIWEGESIEGVTNIVGYAPSACNSQPWLVQYDGELSVYRYRKSGRIGIIPAAFVPFFNRIDIGIFLLFFDLCLEKSGVKYERTLYSDGGGNDVMTLNAVYKIN